MICFCELYVIACEVTHDNLTLGNRLLLSCKLFGIVSFCVLLSWPSMKNFSQMFKVLRNTINGIFMCQL